MKNHKYKITNIRRGIGSRSHFIYAHIEDEDGNLCVCATLEYCVEWIKKNI